MNRIFIGFSNTAGVGIRLKYGFQKIGVPADFYSFRQHPFGYETDKIIKFSKNLYWSRIQKIYFILKLLIRYKYFIYIGSGTGLLGGRKEIKIFKIFKKKTMIIYTGCDARIPEMVEKYKWNTCRECTQEYKDFVNCKIETKKKRIRQEEKIFDFIVSPHECSGYLEKKYFNILWPIDLSKFSKHDKIKNLHKKLRILHAPSNKDYKGSKYIFAAIDKLKNKFEFDFLTVQNVPIHELYKKINESDLIIDQMLCGWYGLFAIESMALARPVLCYIRTEYLGDLDCPIINANPDTLYDVLYSILVNPNQLIEIGQRSRKYVEEYHSDSVVSQDLLNVFNGKE